ncbi:MAG: hypothetical protein P8Y03_21740, partial [Anaerolineales bacterium]
HERRHETINHNWKSGGPWVGLTDSDQGVPSAGFDDDLPDTYETSVGTRNDNVDSCDLATHKSATYNTYGDNEFDAMNTSDGAVGVAANDWANPGKRSTPPGLAHSNAPASLSETNSKSGVAGLYAPYNRALGPAAALAGSLTGSYASAAVDTDTDGKYNQLKISVGLQIDSASLYNVVLWLEDGSSTPIGWANTQQSLAIGNHTVDVYFDGFILQESGLDGPYNVAHIELREGDEEGLVDSADNVHTTAAYLASDFDPRPVASPAPPPRSPKERLPSIWISTVIPSFNTARTGLITCAGCGLKPPMAARCILWPMPSPPPPTPTANSSTVARLSPPAAFLISGWMWIPMAITITCACSLPSAAIPVVLTG